MSTTINNIYSSGLSTASLLFNSGTSSTSASSNASNLASLYSAMWSSYGQNTAASNGTSDYLMSVKNAGSSLNATIGKMLDSSSNLYSQTKYEASDTNALTVTTPGTSTAALKNTQVTVQSVAAAQVNKGASLEANRMPLTQGTSQDLAITDGNGKKLSFSMTQGSNQSNVDFQNQVAAKINASGLAVKASVETDSKTNKSTLVLTSGQTGANSNFSATGSLADALGVSKVTTAASDAVYTVDGKQKTSKTNNVELVSGVNATLKGTSAKAVTFSAQSDATNLVKAANDMVNQYNALLSAANSNISDKGASRLYDRLTSISKTYEKGLNAVGISVNDNGSLSVNQDQMNKAAQSGALEKFAKNTNGGPSYGFMGQMQQIAGQTANSPNSFLSQAVQSTSINQYSSNGARSANFINKMSSYYTVGMMFDSIF